jgi:hypothetical protein
MANKTSQHILGTAANLLGFCLVVITSLHIAQATANTLIDEFTSVVALLFTFSGICSFISIRIDNERREKQWEETANILFLVAMIGIAAIVIFIAISFWGQ